MNRPLPAWFDDAKFGIFVHWTAAAIPAFAPFDAPEDWFKSMGQCPYTEWYQNSLAIDGSPVHRYHREHYGDLPYDAFVEQFLAGMPGWDPDGWADVFAAAGARYVVFVTKHHDGVALWPSAHRNPFKSNWQSERDVVGELAAAVRARGMRFGTYYSGGLDWTFGGTPMTDLRSMFDAIPQSPEYVSYANAHWDELIDRYEPSVLWNDIGYPAAGDLPALFERYYERVPDGVVNNRFDFIKQTSGALHTDFITPEYTTSGRPGGVKWESTRGIGRSFGYNRAEPEDSYLSADALVEMVVDVVARGGNVLLNIGPAGDGSIPRMQADRVLALGSWLSTNGDAIFGTRPWSRTDGTTAEGGRVRYTAKGDGVYAIVLDRLAGGRVTFPDLGADEAGAVELLGHRGPLDARATDHGVEVVLPPDHAAARASGAPATAFRFSPGTHPRPPH